MDYSVKDTGPLGWPLGGTQSYISLLTPKHILIMIKHVNVKI